MDFNTGIFIHFGIQFYHHLVLLRLPLLFPLLVLVLVLPEMLWMS